MYRKIYKVLSQIRYCGIIKRGFIVNRRLKISLDYNNGVAGWLELVGIICVFDTKKKVFHSTVLKSTIFYLFSSSNMVIISLYVCTITFQTISALYAN